MKILLIGKNKLLTDAIIYSFHFFTKNSCEFITLNNIEQIDQYCKIKISSVLVNFELDNLLFINEITTIKKKINVPVYFFSLLNSEIIKNHCLSHGVDHFFSLRNDSLIEMISIIEAKYTSPITKEKNIKNKKKGFSKREIQIMYLLLNGKTSKMIAGELNIGTRSVETFKFRISKKIEKPLIGCVLYS